MCNFVLNNGTIPDKPIVDSVLGGVAVLDFDNDGFLDLYFTNGATLPGMVKDGEPFSNRLYRNKHDGTFEDVTAHAGVAGAGYSMGVAVADYDNDGFADLYVAGVNRNHLFHNNGNGTFTDVTGKAGVTGRDARREEACGGRRRLARLRQRRAARPLRLELHRLVVRNEQALRRRRQAALLLTRALRAGPPTRCITTTATARSQTSRWRRASPP